MANNMNHADLMQDNENDVWPFSFIVGEKFHSFIKNIPDAVVISNPKGQIVACNPAALELFNYFHEKFLSLSIEDLVPMDAMNHKALREKYFENPMPRILGKRVVNLNLLANHGKTIPMDASLFTINTDKGPLAINIIRDMSDKKAKEEALVKKALYDQLTGLPNRYYLNEVYKTLPHLAKRMGLKVGLLLIDLDKFKPINDTFGHIVGDKILLNTGNLLLKLIRKNDTAIRLGGDEFLFLALIDNTQNAKELARRILDNLHTPISIDGKEFITQASIGIAVSNNPDISLNSLIREADAKMYQAKENGGDQWYS